MTTETQNTVTQHQVTQALGVSREAVRQWHHAGTLVGRKVGREMRYNRDDVIAMWRERQVTT